MVAIVTKHSIQTSTKLNGSIYWRLMYRVTELHIITKLCSSSAIIKRHYSYIALQKYNLYLACLQTSINSNNQLPKCIRLIALNYFATIDGGSPAPNGATGPCSCAGHHFTCTCAIENLQKLDILGRLDQA